MTLNSEHHVNECMICFEALHVTVLPRHYALLDYKCTHSFDKLSVKLTHHNVQCVLSSQFVCTINSFSRGEGHH